jgi:hypothetical protein
MIIYFITPILGFLKNYIKYKRIKTFVFLRTPLIYFLLRILFQKITIYEILIYERWFFFIYKIIQSYLNDDYHKKKEKYKIKYNLEY